MGKTHMKQGKFLYDKISLFVHDISSVLLQISMYNFIFLNVAHNLNSS